MAAASLGPPPLLKDRLRNLAPNKRPDFLKEYLRNAIGQRLALETSELGLRDSFMDSGLDSLKAVELKLALETELGVPLASSIAFDHPTVEMLSRFLLETLGLLEKPGDLAAELEAELLLAKASLGNHE